MDKDVVIKDGEYKFNYRVAAVFVNGDKVLLQSTAEDDYLALPGGRVKYNETTIDALKREMKEELGVTLKDSEMTLIHVAENFFGHKDKRFHELLFVYRINNKEVNKQEEIKVIDKETAINKWYFIDSLKDMDVRPRIIIDSIKTKRIIHDIIVD